MNPNQAPRDSLDDNQESNDPLGTVHHDRDEQREIFRRARLSESTILGRSDPSETPNEATSLRVVEPRDAVEADSELEGDDVEGHRRKNGRI